MRTCAPVVLVIIRFEYFVAGMEIEGKFIGLENYILIREENGEAIRDDSGNLLIMNKLENSMCYISPTPEILRFYKIATAEKYCEPVITATEEQDNNQSGTTVTASTTTSKEVWDREAILKLINAYKEHQKDFKSTSIKNSEVWCSIAKQMNLKGSSFTSKQCEWKFTYLKGRYTKKRDNMGNKGSGEAPKKFEYFEEFEEIFGGKPNITPISIASSSKLCDIPEPPNKKTKLEKEISHLTEFFENKNEAKEAAREKRHQERQETLKEGISTYKEMMQKLIDKL